MNSISPHNPDGQRILSIELLRLLAVSGVLVMHSMASPQWVAWANRYSTGPIGVVLFFVISGYVITRTIRADKGRGHPIRNFYIRRSLRLAPPYFALIAFVVFVLPKLLSWCEASSFQWHGFSAHIEPVYTTPLRLAVPWSVWTYCYNQWLIWKGMNFPTGWYGAFWSLCVEEHFYLFWPLVIHKFAAKRLPLAVFLTMMVAAVSAMYYHMIGRGEAVYVATAPQFMALGAGAMLQILDLKPSTGRTFFAVGAFAFGLMCVACWPTGNGDARDLFMRTVFAVGLLMLGVYHAEPLLQRLPAVVAKIIGHLGRMTYGAYLYHGIIGYVASRYVDFNSLASMEWRLLIVVVLLSYVFIERPMVALGRRLTVA